MKSDLKETMCGNWFQDTQLETVEKYTDINLNEADALALFFRTLWFDSGLDPDAILLYKNSGTPMSRANTCPEDSLPEFVLKIFFA